MSEKLNIKVSLRDNPEKENSNLKAFASITISGVTITNVRVVERESNYQTGGKYLDFNMPARSRELEDGSKEYNNLAEITSKNENAEKTVRKEIRKAIVEAYEKKEDEKGFKRAEITSEIEADMSYVNTYVHQAETNVNPNLRAFVTAYIGGIIRLNNLTLTEGVNKETGEIFTAINFPKNQDKEGNYHDVTFTTGEIRDNIKMATLTEMEVQAQTNEQEETMEDEEEDLAM